ncbi:hypothetical protein EDD11_005300 [Mortierella claussenii]|nr:hypothetical protein EDD11_005300 [Mortierella claussenii]
MIRAASTLLLAYAATLALTVSAQAPATASTGCVIATPQEPLRVNHEYKIVLAGCKGYGDVELRYGSATDLDTANHNACTDINYESGTCTFTPKKTGTFSFSATDDSHVETFSGQFQVVKDGDNKKRALYDLSAFAL